MSRSGNIGSSPLARGLLVREDASVHEPGIIPARAGFTLSLHKSGRFRTDHPRSRGVYTPHIPSFGYPKGSSPLARGLRRGRRRRRLRRRIIPARAGFTRPHDHSEPRNKDHPRSRGVYTRKIPAVESIAGSSPLARGLRVTMGRNPGKIRIIPARAGFTPSPRVTAYSGTDHPRSRGVYSLIITALRDAGGSSPLARGLRRTTISRSAAAGIIPARAGFTWRRKEHIGNMEDHPRSRGVYRRRRSAWCASPGSSPLARGLRPRIPTDKSVAGIIPARAGFT